MLIKNIYNNKLKMCHWKPIRKSNIIFSKKNPTVGWNDHLKLDYNSSHHTFKLMANITIYNEWYIEKMKVWDKRILKATIQQLNL